MPRENSSVWKFKHRRDQHHAVQRDALIDQVSAQPGGARGAVAFADQEQRRRPALVAAEIEADELADRRDVALHAKEFLGQFFLGRAAVAGADWIDEDQVGLIEPGLLDCRSAQTAAAACRRRASIFTRRGPIAPRCSQIDAEPGPPLNENISGRLGPGIVERIGNEEDVGFDLVVLAVADGHQAGGRGVVQHASANMNLVMGDDGRRFFLRFGLFGACRILLQLAQAFATARRFG